CGARIEENAEQRERPVGGGTHCHACDQAVGTERASRRRVRPRRVTRLVPQRGAIRPSRVAKDRSRIAHSKKAKAKPKPDKTTEKDRALFGRRMVVPVRFVPGGAPGLGKRR